MQWIMRGAIMTMAGCSSAAAMDAAILRQLKALDPQTRLEQLCDTVAMERINADKTSFKPDKVIAYAFGDPQMGGNEIKAPGAVFRSQGEWYRLTYTCTSGSDHLEVLSLKYRIGARIPHDAWQQHYLYP